MPRRDDLETILVIGSGPIVIGQACEFDYSGTQACRVLRAEGYRVVLVNSNPATIMTDPETADRTYIEPLVPEVLEAVLDRERPQAVLATLGGQTALNLAMALERRGALVSRGIELIGANGHAIETAENREAFKAAMVEIGLGVLDSGFAHSLEEAIAVGERVGLPAIVRPSYILGGAGTGIARDADELRRLAGIGLATSPIGEVLIERSVAGWKEFELEVMRDSVDNCVVVCSIENVDPMGVHTGDSVTVAPAMTLSDEEYQAMRDAAFACIRRIGVETGGSNIQFAIDPRSGEMVVIEMNPRVSRSSALASKATGFPIAKIAARLAVGYTLDEVANDITRRTPACFEPTIDYVVTKVPRWAFEKFPGVPDRLGTRMQSVGEVMAIGRTFAESLQKALRSLESGHAGLGADGSEVLLGAMDTAALDEAVQEATPDRLFLLGEALRRGQSVEDLASRTGIDPWFLDQMAQIVEHRRRIEAEAAGQGIGGLSLGTLREAKQLGFSDEQLAWLTGSDRESVAARREELGLRSTFKTVDTCGAEFDAETPYHYSTWEDEDEVRPSGADRVVILGSGPNRIGQGIEFDYCCVHASIALRACGIETVMVNCNPETVSTDYDTSDRLYFEPIGLEEVLAVLDAERRAAAALGGRLLGVVVSLGGQTPLKLANALPAELVLGTPPRSIDAAEDREQWSALCRRLGVRQPPGRSVTSAEAAAEVAAEIGYPVLVRPSYVLGGRAMEIVYDEASLRRAVAAWEAGGSLGREGGLSAERPLLVDKFLEDAVEVDVDALRDRAGETLVVGIMEHVEEAGVHSGDSACVIPPPTLAPDVQARLASDTKAIADALGVVGPINVQFAVRDGEVFVLEANPRASRTVPFVSKATGIPMARAAARLLIGATLAELRREGVLPERRIEGVVSVKEAVLPFGRFAEADALLGPEMRSTGEVMGVDRTFGLAFAKSQEAAGSPLPSGGQVFLSLADRDKAGGVELARRLVGLGFALAATSGTAACLRAEGVPVALEVAKVGDDGDGVDGVGRPTADALGLIDSGAIQLVVNTPEGRGPRADGGQIRRAALARGVPVITTLAAARAAVAGMEERSRSALVVRCLQDLSSDDVAEPAC